MKDAMDSNEWKKKGEVPRPSFPDVLKRLELACKLMSSTAIRRSWWRAGCVPTAWVSVMKRLDGGGAALMFEPIVSVLTRLQMAIENFKRAPGMYMTSWDFVGCDEDLLIKWGVIMVEFEEDEENEDEIPAYFCIPEGPLYRDVRTRQRVVRMVAGEYSQEADKLGIPVCQVPEAMGAHNEEPPASLSLLTDLHTLTLTHSAALQAPEFTNLCSLATLSVDISEHDEELDLTTLVHLPAFANLALCGETKLNLEGENAHPVSFARMAHLESLEFDYNSSRFSLLFPSGVTFSRLERLLFSGCDKLERLPDDIGERMPRLRDLTISSCHNLPELPDHFTSLHCLQKLTISSLDLTSLSTRFGKLSVLKDFTLHRLPISGLPDSFHQLTSLDVLNVHDCLAMVKLGASFGSLHALKSLSIANSPKLVLPEDIGGLTDLHTFRVTLNSVQELLPSSFTQLMSLTRLELNLCDMIQELPEGLERLSNLRELSIWSRSTIQKLPESITDLGSLEVLRVDGCSSLCSIPGSLSALGRLRELAIGKCAQLPELSNSLPPSLEVLSLGCPQQLTPLTELPVLPML
ncbi:unnamed protein product [Closterium sp. NIES-65]|nr:unnamed protein product [Closterium sp. NIES-65]